MRLRLGSLLLAAPAVWLLTGCAVVGYPVQGAGSGDSRPVPTPGPTAASPGGGYGTGPGQYYEIGGRRYHVLRSADGYRRRGLASWYGPGFHGRRTSSGESYDQNGMTAAHRTLPLGTWVEVRNLETDRTVVVRINDRGPFKDPDERIIDVSYAAARTLEIVGNGTGHVEVVALTDR